MQVLLDTHFLLWALQDDDKLPDEARRIILDESNGITYKSKRAEQYTSYHYPTHLLSKIAHL